eukprot:CAMPEP_0182925146 /NCGR_PEP_ID=MMETSP0105_2-20130417/8250_1 /TAXON_ID=81532 ORGANISM="Acanthoeca-like sp., Strain 10tr" /NCGR_SAMPLE_ID=MMETSP0105_2 /ASSEMBLY_ACC=CAM_ASM_000205 /LENGTH=78 /DNA_ID=CAMNT_0025062979 /DNA_START=144 /DNA_END=379 /DNA_ORIENTATION=-
MAVSTDTTQGERRTPPLATLSRGTRSLERMAVAPKPDTSAATRRPAVGAAPVASTPPTYSSAATILPRASSTAGTTVE